MKDSISVITPCYNAEKFLNECIQSVEKSQMLGIFEIQHVLIDDGSNDKTFEIFSTLKHKNIIKIILPINVGQSIARNEGLKKATGKYIFFLDADDILFENSLRYLYE